MTRAGSGPRPRDSTKEAISAPRGRTPWRPFLSPERLGEVDSTNSELLRRAAAGAPEGVVIVADSQTAGRGRLGRRWYDRPGASLLCSILFRRDFEPEHLHLASTVVALAALDAARAVGAALSCKWPNDLVGPRGEKAAGILAEATPDAALVVGIGLNCAPVVTPDEAADTLSPPATSLADLAGRPVERENVLASLLEGVASRWERLASPGRVPSSVGALELMAEYRRACATIGATVRVDLGRRRIVGVADDVADDGRLVVSADGERVVVSAGDVVHLRSL